jgi:hypothetical protein
MFAMPQDHAREGFQTAAVRCQQQGQNHDRQGAADRFGLLGPEGTEERLDRLGDPE